MNWLDPTSRRRLPRPSYPFQRRCDRQRVAQRLGLGMATDEVAAIERAEPSAIRRLLSDEGFGRLVEHYRTLGAMDHAERLARLTGEAMLLLELGIGAGDLRVAAFVVHEAGHGRDPAATLAAKVDAVLARACGTEPPRAPGEPVPEPTPPPDAAADARPPARCDAQFSWCAATQPDELAAVELAEQEAGRAAGRLGRTIAGLTGRLVRETERVGTASLPPAVAARLTAFAEAAHATPARCLAAARPLEHRRRDYAEARPPRPLPPAAAGGDGRRHDPG